jgi:hypothetical protein
VDRSPGVRVLTVADLASTLKVVELGGQAPTAATQSDLLRSARVFSPQGLGPSSGASGVGSFGPVADYTATLEVTIQRRAAEE